MWNERFLDFAVTYFEDKSRELITLHLRLKKSNKKRKSVTAVSVSRSL